MKKGRSKVVGTVVKEGRSKVIKFDCEQEIEEGPQIYDFQLKVTISDLAMMALNLFKSIFTPIITAGIKAIRDEIDAAINGKDTQTLKAKEKTTSEATHEENRKMRAKEKEGALKRNKKEEHALEFNAMYESYLAGELELGQVM